eukprot:GCRY01002830.1.p1 GENE.GCRY01002830.1~~GCRY01002830.1.p1  ORF type:complete len:281 (+),score=17.43 GCRY01002830.1:130-972(+)
MHMLLFNAKTIRLPANHQAITLLLLFILNSGSKCSIEQKSITGEEMCWRSSGNTYKELLDHLHENHIIKHDDVHSALLNVDRKFFTKQLPYEDSPQPIGYSATISAPHMHAWCMELLRPQLSEGTRALDVGSGSGYLSAVMSEFMGPDTLVVGIEHVPELVKLSNENVARSNPHLLESGRLKFVTGDGRKGYQSEGPYNAIHVGAAATEIPHALVEQLAPGGRLIIPVGGSYGQDLIQVDKDSSGHVTQKRITGVIYVPLCDLERQLGKSSTISHFRGPY